MCEWPEGMDTIEIDDLLLRCVIGVRAEERRDRSDVVIGLRIAADTRPAATSDAIEHAWNYRTAVKAVIALVEKSSFHTVEALADAIARCLVAHGTPHVQVTVHKPGALRFARTVGVRIERRAADYPRAAAGQQAEPALQPLAPAPRDHAVPA
ncbi:dihydroneopterin aldolase [Streptomyces sp. SCSIO 30461]|uniref:dihydroneopterin aldolase n=1 Tax=Streptomyces sp. SCSIO 30461 TaxID=3118085 RepID=UPI0030D5F769